MPYIKKRISLPKEVPAYKALMENLGFSIGKAQQMIDKKRVFCKDGELTTKNQLVSDFIEIIAYEPNPKGLKPIYENAHFALFDKPSGVLTHPAGRKTLYSLTDEILHLYGNSAHIVHRLDKETSGLILVAKNLVSEIELKKLFEDRAVSKSYIAFVKGHLDKKLKIDAPLLNSSEYENLKQKMIVSNLGKDALTKIEPVKYIKDKDFTIIKAIPITGRQHQIRAHLFHVKHPIVGDPLYGVNYDVSCDYLDEKLSKNERIIKTGASRLLLHAYSLSFKYRGKSYFFQSGIGDQFLKATSILN
ncbi:MAG: RluA family pseudouridine synthase [Sulfurospirillaceae bacterium]|nr:RluA family pseudouridine synthase [Sulfurospirillaceae bacterium]MDY0237964.1 RluA family pseudouridine synthase [Campylobacterales bacterium]